MGGPNVSKRMAAAYRRNFDSEPQWLVRAPGRVNLIGEHTDYNDGFVLPMAIDREVRIALTPRSDGRVRLHSVDLGKQAEFDIEALERGEGWAEYLKGVAWALLQEGFELTGFDGVLSGNVPRGSGLSSSAAVELATARAFHRTSGFPWDRPRMARVCQRAENEWLGVASGIMDQLASAAGQSGHALLIDCRSLNMKSVPLPPEVSVLVLDTSTRRGLVGSAYNERRRQCEAAADHFGVRALRDVDEATFEEEATTLEPLLRKRARHVVTENARTLAAAEAMRRGDTTELGRLMDESHASLRNDFEVSSDALDAIVESARAQPGCYGARLTGAGFGGCAVALMSADQAPAAAQRIEAAYRAVTGLDAQVYLCRAADGAGDMSI